MDTITLIQEIERLPMQKFLIMETTLQSIKRHEMAHETKQSLFQEAFGALDTLETAEKLIEIINSSRVFTRRVEEI